MKNKINIEDLKKTGQLESESAYILDICEDNAKYSHLKNIAYKIGLWVNQHAEKIYSFIGIINILLVIFSINSNVSLCILFCSLSIILFVLERCHKFYLKENLRIIESEIGLARNRFSKNN